MQTEKHKPLSPSYRIWFDRETERAEGSGNVKAAIYVLHMEGFAAYETADGLLVQEIVDREECDGSRAYIEQPRLFQMSGNSVDMLAIHEYLGN